MNPLHRQQVGVKIIWNGRGRARRICVRPNATTVEDEYAPSNVVTAGGGGATGGWGSSTGAGGGAMKESDFLYTLDELLNKTSGNGQIQVDVWPGQVSGGSRRISCV